MRNYQPFILLGSLLVSAASIHAKPAKPGLREYIQPDGTKIEIKVVGDEYLHFTTTPDDILLFLDEDGYYKPGTFNNDGSIVALNVTTYNGIDNSKLVNIKDIDRDDILSRRKTTKRRLAPQSGIGLTKTACPSTGSPRALIILVEYSDVKFNQSYNAVDYFNDMINGDNFTQFGGTGSALKYFRDQSGGKFTPQFDVLGPVTLPHNQAYYGKNDRFGDDINPQLMVTDAIDILDAKVNFSVYDTNKDGVIDNVYIFYAGQGEADFGDENSIWPHSWDVRSAGVNKVVDGVIVGHYACSNEWSETTPDGMGSFVHEYSHVLGLPDLYHTESSNADYTPGSYSVMDYGNYNNDSRTPCNYTAYERNALGWFEPIVLGEPQSLILPDISSGKFCLIPTTKDTEFFLLENRQQTGWDKYIANHGMLIWHIDYNASDFDNNTVNNSRLHQRVDIVEANNSPGINFEVGYTFPGTTGKTAFTSETSPALKSWSGKKINVPITNIAEKDGRIYFDVCGGGTQYEAGINYAFDDKDYVPEYYNLQGVRILNPAKGMMLIEKRGDRISKIIY